MVQMTAGDDFQVKICQACALNDCYPHDRQGCLWLNDEGKDLRAAYFYIKNKKGFPVSDIDPENKEESQRLLGILKKCGLITLKKGAYYVR